MKSDRSVGEPVAVVRSPKPKPGGSTPPTFANPPSSSGRTAGLGPANGGSNPSGGTRALTPAQRHKRYREKLGDVYREANRLRMREKRSHDV